MNHNYISMDDTVELNSLLWTTNWSRKPVELNNSIWFDVDFSSASWREFSNLLNNSTSYDFDSVNSTTRLVNSSCGTRRPVLWNWFTNWLTQLRKITRRSWPVDQVASVRTSWQQTSTTLRKSTLKPDRRNPWKSSPQKQPIMEHSPGLPQEKKPLRSCSRNRAKILLKGHLRIKYHF